MLVQSIPLETESTLAQSDLPYAKDVWLAQIKAAKRTIDLSQFYVASPSDGSESAIEPIFRALEEAGERGVKIRFLVSSDLLDEDPKSFARVKAIKNCETRIYDIHALTGGILHNKYWVFDRERIYVGSQNFDWRSLEQIHETGVLVNDVRVANELGRVFEIDWEVARSKRAPTAAQLSEVQVGISWSNASALGASPTATASGSGASSPQSTALPAGSSATPGTSTGLSPSPTAAPLGNSALTGSVAKSGPNHDTELVASPAAWNPAGTRAALPALLELIGGAKHSLRIQLLDYSLKSRTKKPWTEIDDALRAAARRGVKIEMIVSNWNLSPPGVDQLKHLQAVPHVEIRFATIPVWSKRFVPYSRVVHSKYLVVDGETLWLGTSNWSEDYFYASRNVELIFKRPELAKKADQIFTRLWLSPYVAWLDPAKAYLPPDISGKKKK